MLLRWIAVVRPKRDEPPAEAFLEPHAWEVTGSSHELRDHRPLRRRIKLLVVAWLVEEYDPDALRGEYGTVSLEESFFDEHFTLDLVESYGDGDQEVRTLRRSPRVQELVAMSDDAEARAFLAPTSATLR